MAKLRLPVRRGSVERNITSAAASMQLMLMAYCFIEHNFLAV